ncbi:hypothetical protein BGZ61DRAFT_404246 [Ilyonectria robusta]|uniref:uncharacterized protein n=1 Tax=Ilyonectria robusta TaxID=1079257 RepID=UPI001E8DB651|nr:uncharacterized protein BGZ61DRAFT_404246 [Ilyonectria robusta]KAH8657321.1 hypothetical protein BGZ61DRAFT_404246 [Ilyonectria robusta]
MVLDKLTRKLKHKFHRGKNDSGGSLSTLDKSGQSSIVPPHGAPPQSPHTSLVGPDLETTPAPVSSPADDALNHESSTKNEESVDPEKDVPSQEEKERAPDSETASFETLPPISSLWDEAFDGLESNSATKELMNAYESLIAKSNKGQNVPKERGSRRDQLDVFVEEKTDEIEKGSWKIRFKDHEFLVKDLVEPVVSIVDWGKEYVGQAVKVSTPASLAWAGVCLLLPLLLNPSEQEASRIGGLDKIACIIRECSLREALYRSRYETPDNERIPSDSIAVHKEYRESIKVLYSQIISFQASYVCFLSEHNTAVQLIQDMVKWEDWDSMIEDITAKNENLKSLDEKWQGLSQEEEWKAMTKHHQENLTKLDAIHAEMERFSGLLRAAEDHQERKELLIWLQQAVTPSVHYDAAVEKRRKHSTGTWFLQSDKFREWESASNSLLWVIGKAGAGKSVLSSTIIQHLTETYEEDPYIAVVYFYISANDKATRSVNNLTRSLVTQLFGLRPDKPKVLTNLGTYQYASGAPPQSKLEEALCSAAGDFTQTYVVIDGLDECPSSGDSGSGQGERRVLLDLLETMQAWELKNLHLLTTSRREHDIEKALEEIPQCQILDLTAKGSLLGVGGDIGLYIDNELRRGIFRTLSADLKDKIKRDLLAKADGVFHYVSLQLDNFQAPLTKKSVETTLAGLPKDLDETYKKALGRLTKEQRPLAIRALTWVSFSLTPLTILGLAAAVPVDFVKTTTQSSDTTEESYSLEPLNPDDKLEHPLDVLYLLPGLHNLQSKEALRRAESRLNPSEKPHQVVVLTHFTLLEYLTSDGIKDDKSPAGKFALSKSTANLQLAEACLRYHIDWSQNASSLDRNQARKEYGLCDYAASYGLRHAESIGRINWSLSLQRMVRFVMQDGDEPFAKLKLHSDYNSRRAHDLPVQYAVDKSLLETVAFLLDVNMAEVNFQPEVGEALIIQAVKNRDEAMVRLLLVYGADAKTKTRAGEPALCEALRNNDPDMVQLLLEFNADIEAKTEKGDPALVLAARHRDVPIVKVLLENGADVNASNRVGETALFEAVLSGKKALVQAVLAKKPNVCAQTRNGETALHRAVVHGDRDLVQRLLRLGADANATTETGETPLHWAASFRFGSDGGIMKLLLGSGAKVNEQTHLGDTALHLTARTLEYSELKFRLEYGADVNTANKAGETAAFLAARASRG